MRLQRLLLATLALGAAAPASEAAAAGWRGAPAARAVGLDGATLVAGVPLGVRGKLHFSWRAAGGRWQRATPLQPRRGRTVSVRLEGLKPATEHAFRLVAGGRTIGASWFRTLAPAPPPPPEPRPERTPPPPEPVPEPVPAPAPEPAPQPTPEPEPVAPEAGYLNPLFRNDFPDPMVLRAGDEYWAYSTGDRFPVMRSSDLVHWRSAGRALADRPDWAVTGADWHPWAPSVAKTAGGYVLFHVALSDAFGPRTNCIGVATAATPAGPFAHRGILRDGAGAPVGCGDADGYGNIDPAPFVDADGKPYLYVSTDWACDPGESRCKLAPQLGVIPLAADLLSAAGPRVRLFRGLPGTWEQAPWAPVVENPWVVERDGTYHLLYSGGPFTGDYGMGHATATSPLGPFTRTARVLEGTEAVRGPGGGMVVAGPKGADWLVYHGRSETHEAPRSLRIDPLAWPDEEGVPPLVGGPTSAPVTQGP